MWQPSSPQSRFLLRASLYLVALLAAWWFVLLPPLLAWTRLSADFILNAIPGAPLKTGVTITPEGVWVVQAPVKVANAWRNVRVESARRLPMQLTMALPLFWAILLASRLRSGPRWLAGSAVLLVIPPLGLLLYVAHVVQLYVFPSTPALVRAGLSAADYVASTVLPYVGPVLLALVVDPALRREVLALDVVLLPEGGTKPPVDSGG